MGFLTDIKDSLGAFWDILLLFIGSLLAKIYFYIKAKVKQSLIKSRVNQTAEMKDLNIITLSSATPYFEKNAIETKLMTDKKLYIGFPEEHLQKVLENDPGFEIHSDTSFDGKNNFKDLVYNSEISNLLELIEKHRYIVADYFIYMTEGCKFNRSKLGVYRFITQKSPDVHENPTVKLYLYKTDYFTHRVFRSIYNELKENNHPISQVKTVEELKKYNAFTTSLGINAFIFMNSTVGESVIFSRRSLNAAYSENHLKYNSTVMEGVSLTDFDDSDNVVSLRLALEKGLMEELGVSKAYLDKIDCDPPEFCDFFLERNYFEIGVTAILRIDGLFEETIRDLPAKDKELEVDKLVPIPKTKRHLEDFLKKENVYNQAMYTLKMVCARSLVFINLPKKS